MSSSHDISAPTLLTGSILLLTVFAISSPDLPVSFSQGRVWLILLAFGSLALLSLRKLALPLNSVQRLSRHPHNVLLLLWLLSATISASLAPQPTQAFFGSFWGQMGVLQLGLCVLLFLVVQGVHLEGRHWRVLSAGVGVLLLLTSLEAIGLRPLFWLPEATVYPAVTTGQRGHLAGLYAVIAGVATVRRAYPTLLMAGLGIALCNNTSALLGVMTLVAVALFRHRQDWRPLLLSATFILSAFLGTTRLSSFCPIIPQMRCIETKNVSADNQASINGRLHFWKASLAMFVERPLLGWGDEQYAERWLTYLPETDQLPVARLLLGIAPDVPLSGQFPAYSYERPDGKLEVRAINNIHPHNAALGELQNHGLIGLLLLTAVTITLFRQRPEAVLAMLGYGVYLLAWFPVFAVLPIAALLTGTLAGQRPERSRTTI